MNAPLAVIDTNILVSGLLSSRGPPGRIIDAVREGRLTPVYTQDTLAEYQEVLLRPRLRIDPAAVHALLANLRSFGLLMDTPVDVAPDNLPDPDDWPFITCALAADCPVITGNAKDFPARLGVRVKSAREWVDQAKSEADAP